MRMLYLYKSVFNSLVFIVVDWQSIFLWRITSAIETIQKVFNE